MPPLENQPEERRRMPETYTPILRPGSNERQVIQSFGGLAEYIETDRDLSLKPLVEVGLDADLDQLEPFQDAGEEVFVDLPQYMTNYATGLTDSVNQTITEYGSREEFFRANSQEIGIPTVSTFAEPPVRYGIHKSMHLALEDTFDRIVHRLIVRSRKGGFTENQKSALAEIADLARPESDIILFDVYDVGYQEGGIVDENLSFLVDTFQGFEMGVLNVFDAMEDQNVNYTPILAERLGCEIFGDFAINKRFPPEDGGPPPVVYLRHYYPNHGEVEKFEGEDYAEAANQLVGWADYEAGHCEYCREAANAVQRNEIGNPSKWKQIRMGHYIESALKNQI